MMMYAKVQTSSPLVGTLNTYGTITLAQTISHRTRLARCKWFAVVVCFIVLGLALPRAAALAHCLRDSGWIIREWLGLLLT